MNTQSTSHGAKDGPSVEDMLLTQFRPLGETLRRLAADEPHEVVPTVSQVIDRARMLTHFSDLGAVREPAMLELLRGGSIEREMVERWIDEGIIRDDTWNDAIEAGYGQKNKALNAKLSQAVGRLADEFAALNEQHQSVGAKRSGIQLSLEHSSKSPLGAWYLEVSGNRKDGEQVTYEFKVSVRDGNKLDLRRDEEPPFCINDWEYLARTIANQIYGKNLRKES